MAKMAGSGKGFPYKIYRAVRDKFKDDKRECNIGEERGAEFYNQTFHENPGWRDHYTASPYYFLWTIIIDRIRRRGKVSVLEVGCGSGQLANALSDAGVVGGYVGLDFSEARVMQACANCPQYRFEVADVFKTDLFRSIDYDLVIATEFLEHVERDCDVIRFIRPGSWFIGTVPNFPFESHVRHFLNREEVISRYATLINNIRVDSVFGDSQGKTFFLIEGEKS